MIERVTNQDTIIVVNSTHFCRGYSSTEEALGQIDRCGRLGASAMWHGGPDLCQVTTLEALYNKYPELGSQNCARCPFGSFEGNIDHSITVVTPMDEKWNKGKNN